MQTQEDRSQAQPEPAEPRQFDQPRHKPLQPGRTGDEAQHPGQIGNDPTPEESDNDLNAKLDNKPDSEDEDADLDQTDDDPSPEGKSNKSEEDRKRKDQDRTSGRGGGNGGPGI